MNTVISPTYFALAWLIGIIITMEIGKRFGSRQLAKYPTKEMAGMDMMGASVFTLCGLLLAFTLTGSASRYDDRRMLIAEEANDIGTAYLRLSLLPDSVQPPLRALFKDYLTARINTYSKEADLAVAMTELKRSEGIQMDIWNRSVAATQIPGGHVDAAKLLLPALNEMIDITTTRLMAARIHPPSTMYILLFILGLSCSLVVGIRSAGRKGRNWFHVLLFAIVMSTSAYVILALEYPRKSFINLGEYDQVLIDLRKGMQ